MLRFANTSHGDRRSADRCIPRQGWRSGCCSHVLGADQGTGSSHGRQRVEPPLDRADIVAGDVDDDLDLSACADCCAPPAPHTATAVVLPAAPHARTLAADALADGSLASAALMDCGDRNGHGASMRPPSPTNLLRGRSSDGSAGLCAVGDDDSFAGTLEVR